MPNLIISDTQVRQDAEGRYSLNDLHRAAGEEKRHQPANFLRIDSAQGLIDEINQSSEVRSEAVSVVYGGSSPGTFVCRELVYAYAMWISPAFHLKVIRAYDASTTQSAPIPDKRPPNQLSEVRGTMREMLGLARLCGLKGNQAILSANRATETSTGVAPLALLGITHLDADQQEILLTTTEAGESLGLARNKTYPHLAALGLVTGYRDHKDRQCWELTDMGKQVGGIYQDTGKKHGDGVPVRQIRWTKSAVEWIKGKSVVGGTEGVQ